MVTSTISPLSLRDLREVDIFSQGPGSRKATSASEGIYTPLHFVDWGAEPVDDWAAASVSADCPSPASNLNNINLNELAGALASSPVQTVTQDLTVCPVGTPVLSSGYGDVLEGTTVPSMANSSPPVEATCCLPPFPPFPDDVADASLADAAASQLPDPDFDPDWFPPPPPEFDNSIIFDSPPPVVVYSEAEFSVCLAIEADDDLEEGEIVD